MRSVILIGVWLAGLPILAGNAHAQSLSQQFLSHFSHLVDSRQADVTASISQTDVALPDAAPVSVAEAMAGSPKVAPQIPTNILPPPSRGDAKVAQWPDSNDWVTIDPEMPVADSQFSFRLGPGTGAMVGINIPN